MAVRTSLRRASSGGGESLRALVILALLSGCHGVGDLELLSLGQRAAWQRPERVVSALAIEPGDRVVDLGAGDGYFLGPLVEAVGPAGKVYAVEVDPNAIVGLRELVAERGYANVEVVAAATDDPALPDGAVDLVLVVNTYHHIEGRGAYFRALRTDLSGDGRLAVVDPNEDLRGLLRLFLDEGHTSSARGVTEELRGSGYRLVARHEFLPVQLFLVFSPR